MQRIFWILMTCLMAGAACAADSPTFSERVERAKAMEELPGPHQYIEKNIFPLLQDPAMVKKMNKCVKAPGASKESFTMVFDITREGKVAGVDYDRRTNTAQCLAAVWGALKLAPPPGNDSLPIYINWSFSDEQPSK